MKRLLFVFIVFLSVPTSHAQDGNFYWGIRLDHSRFNTTDYSGVGLNLEGFLSDNLSIEYSVLFGKTREDHLYFYTGCGQAVAIYGAKNLDFVDNASISLLLIGFILPESVNFYLPMKEDFQLSLFLSPWGFEMAKSYNSSYEQWYGSFEFGIRGHIKKGQNVKISPQLGIKRMYSNRLKDWGINLGVTFSYGKNE